MSTGAEEDTQSIPEMADAGVNATNIAGKSVNLMSAEEYIKWQQIKKAMEGKSGTDGSSHGVVFKFSDDGYF